MAVKRNAPPGRLQRPTKSESEAWRDVQAHANAIIGLALKVAPATPLLRTHAAALVRLADTMRSQLAHGVHANPPLAVMAFNPPQGSSSRVLSHRVYAIEYKHAGDGNDYRHDFAAGVNCFVHAKNLSVSLYRPDGKPLAREFP